MNLKQQAAHRALSFVQSGMVLGLGSGSTNAYFIEMLAQQLDAGTLKDVVGVPTSENTAIQARDLGIPLTTLAAHSRLDLAIDGADEVDPKLNLIKGLGRALLREKIVEVHADRFLVIVDESKMVPRLGSHSPLPVEIVPFEFEAHVRWLNGLGCHAELWREKDGAIVMTDNDHYLVRCWFTDGIADPYGLAQTLADRPGVVEHGLFLDMASGVIVATSNGVRFVERSA